MTAASDISTDCKIDCAARLALRTRVLAALLLTVFVLGALPAECGWAAAAPATVTIGEPVTDLLDRLRTEGLALVYSSAIVSPDLTVTLAPASTEPLAVLREVLATHRLTLTAVDDFLVVTRDHPTQAPDSFATLLVTVRDAGTRALIDDYHVSGVPGNAHTERIATGYKQLSKLEAGRYRLVIDAPGYSTVTRKLSIEAGSSLVLNLALQALPAPIPRLVVTASQYELVPEQGASHSYISQRSIEHLPDFGEDPIRAIRRLPGTASGGASAKSYIRGGEEDEAAIILNGQRLMDPFHVRDYQSLFSAIDVRAIDGVEVYTGGFPARYGDRMSGLILVDTLPPDTPQHTEVGLSVFNTSLLSAGTVAGGDAGWVFSARRGNLDLIIDPKFGEPAYFDVFAEIGVNLAPGSSVSANGLVSRDDVLIVTKNDPTESEQSRNDARNTHVWVHWEQAWQEQLISNTTVAVAHFTSTRLGYIDDTEKIIAAVDDRRGVDQFSLRQDWRFPPLARHRFSAGWEYQNLAGTYNYFGSAEYFGTFEAFSSSPLLREVRRLVDGDTYAFYLSDQWAIRDDLQAEIGIRWDKQTYSDRARDRQLSPRFSLVHRLTPKTDLQMSLGRYFQSQGIHELQVEDGVNQYLPAQRADHAIAGMQHRFGKKYELRAEAYWKSFQRLRPRYENLLDPLALIPELLPDRVRINPERASARGIELSLARHSSSGLSWWSTYTFSKTEDQIAGRDIPRSWDQRHAVQVGLAWSNSRWDVGVAVNVHSGWPRTPVMLQATGDPSAPDVVFGERNSDRYGYFGTLDLRASYQWPLRNSDLNAYFELSNATNRNNPCCVEFDLNRDVNGAVFLEQTDDYWLPILPAIGIRWQF